MAAAKAKPVRVGEKVTFNVGTRRLRGEVIEDRGTLGVAGRRLVRVRVGKGDAASDFELPAEDVHVNP